MYMFGWGINFAFISTMFLLDFRTVLTM